MTIELDSVDKEYLLEVAKSLTALPAEELPYSQRLYGLIKLSFTDPERLNEKEHSIVQTALRYALKHMKYSDPLKNQIRVIYHERVKCGIRPTPVPHRTLTQIFDPPLGGRFRNDN